MTNTPRKKRRDDAVVSAYFDWQKRFRQQLLAHPAAQRNPRLFCLGFVLSEMFDWQNFDCHPSRENLAEKLGITVTQVSALTKELAHLGFIQVKRRRNTSAIYVGTMPQEVNSTSLPDAVKSDADEDQEVKSSEVRKSSAVDFGKSSGLDPNVVRNVALNEGGGALHAPAADTVINNDLRPDQIAPASAPLRGAAVAPEITDDDDIIAARVMVFSAGEDPEEFFERVADDDILGYADRQARGELLNAMVQHDRDPDDLMVKLGRRLDLGELTYRHFIDEIEIRLREARHV